MRTSWPLRFDRYTSSLGTAMPDDCSSRDRSRPRSELPGTYGKPKASLTTGLSAPPISKEPFPAPIWRPVWHSRSPSRINLPTSFSSVCAVCELNLRSSSLFVVGDNGLKQVAEALVAPRFVLARHLQQQL